MRNRSSIVLGLLVALWAINSSLVYAQLGDLLKGVQEILSTDKLSEGEIIQGLKEAIQIGTGNAVKKGSQIDGYYKDPEIKIPLPEEIQKVQKFLVLAGLDQQVNDFELSMNRAAEQAAPQAKNLFWEAIKQMTFSDAQKILEGQDNETTIYFKDKTYSQLQEIFKPIVHQNMSQVGVTRLYQDLDTRLKSLPFVGRRNLDLDQYVTDRALDGLFFLVAEEEKKIRQDPEARVTDLLKKVFGSR